MEKPYINILSKLFRAEKKVKLAYLFGSAASGAPGKLSDVDIAVFVDDTLRKTDILELELKLLHELVEILKTDRVDLVVMNDAPLLLNYNIIKHGKILTSNEMERMKIERSILSKYLDRKYSIDRHAIKLIERVARIGLK